MSDEAILTQDEYMYETKRPRRSCEPGLGGRVQGYSPGLRTERVAPEGDATWSRPFVLRWLCSMSGCVLHFSHVGC